MTPTYTRVVSCLAHNLKRIEHNAQKANRPSIIIVTDVLQSYDSSSIGEVIFMIGWLTDVVAVSLLVVLMTDDRAVLDLSALSLFFYRNMIRSTSFVFCCESAFRGSLARKMIDCCGA